MISETAKNPFTGIGKSEPLKHELKGYRSRRITDEHRLVYKATDETYNSCLQVSLRLVDRMLEHPVH